MRFFNCVIKVFAYVTKVFITKTFSREIFIEITKVFFAKIFFEIIIVITIIMFATDFNITKNLF